MFNVTQRRQERKAADRMKSISNTQKKNYFLLALAFDFRIFHFAFLGVLCAFA